MTKYPLVKGNRLRLARAFRNIKRVDISIDCVIEGQMGKAFTDNPQNPTAFMIQQGPLCYFAGDRGSAGGQEMLRSLPPYTLIMPSPPEWIAAAQEIHGDKLVPLRRYSFSSRNLSINHLGDLLCRSKLADRVMRINNSIAARVLNDPQSFIDISEFDSAEDFVERGIGFCLVDDDSIIGTAYSSLACSKGIEVSLFVKPEHRRRGIGTALAVALIKHCVENGIDPHWDAANPQSCRLAERLGYVQIGTYQAYLLQE